MTVPEYAPASILFAGRPQTGKTTFLALLYVAIVDGRAHGLELGSYQDDREYLNRISRHLQQCQPAKHTEVGEQQQLTLSLLVGSDRAPTMLQIPDTSGETWDTALGERQWPADLDQRVTAADAVMIFVHPGPDVFDSGTTIVETNAVLAALREDNDNDDPPAPAARFPHEHAPTQVELVDLLQMLREHRGPRPARACIVISAYDLVPADLAPRDWLRSACPLVAQYIDVNRDWLHVDIYGVSAQGGEFDDDDTRAALAEQDTVDRALVRAADGAPARPEDPFLWALQRHA